MTFEQLDEYYKKFGDTFPVSELKGYSESEQTEMLKECLQQGKPFEDLFEVDNKLIY